MCCLYAGHEVNRDRMLRRLQKTRIPIYPLPSSDSRRGRTWATRFEPTLGALARTATDAVDDELRNDAVEGAWSCVRARGLLSFLGQFLPGLAVADLDLDQKSTLDEWYAVQTLEVNFLARKQRKLSVVGSLRFRRHAILTLAQEDARNGSLRVAQNGALPAPVLVPLPVPAADAADVRSGLSGAPASTWNGTNATCGSQCDASRADRVSHLELTDIAGRYTNTPRPFPS